MTVEYFEIVPRSKEQQEDAGWYFQRLHNGDAVGEPCGPYPFKTDAVAEFDAALAKA